MFHGMGREMKEYERKIRGVWHGRRREREKKTVFSVLVSILVPSFVHGHWHTHYVCIRLVQLRLFQLIYCRCVGSKEAIAKDVDRYSSRWTTISFGANCIACRPVIASLRNASSDVIGHRIQYKWSPKTDLGPAGKLVGNNIDDPCGSAFIVLSTTSAVFLYLYFSQENCILS